MSTSKHFDKLCCAILAVVILLTALFMNAAKLGVQAVSAAVGYASRLFDTSMVHTIDIVMDDWDSFIENCTDEQYADCTVIIDGEAYRNVAIRAKGNTSLTSVESYDNDRYSFKIEFDHYDNAVSYYGLDKLCLNNIIQDNTYMKDYLVYQLMRESGADAPLCSYSYITVNGNDWGLYLAVEGIEDSFLQRNYGNDYGQLYKPDSMDMGGGRGNGREFNMENFAMPGTPDDRENMEQHREDNPPADREYMERTPNENIPADRENMERFQNGNLPAGSKGDETSQDGAPHDFNAGSNDVSLIYTDDEFDSYSNIFDNAKTDLTDTDKARLINSLKELNNNENIENIIDIDEVIRYFVVHNFVLNFDSYTGNMIHNYYLYEENGQLSMIPWDYNLAFGGFEAQSNVSELVNYPIDTPVSGGTVDSRPMLAWIFNNEEYTNLYHQYFAEFIDEYFDNGKFETMLDSTEQLIAPYVESDPTKFCTYEEFEKGVSALKDFCVLRAESVSGQLNGTIPSTSEGQAQDTSAFISADGLVLSDMGTMNHMMGGRSPDNNKRFDDFAPPNIQNTRPADHAATLILLGVSVSILIFGLMTALLYKRRL